MTPAKNPATPELMTQLEEFAVPSEMKPVSLEMKPPLVSTETAREKALAEISRMMVNGIVTYGTYQKIARSMSIPVGTLKTWHHRDVHRKKRDSAGHCIPPNAPSKKHQCSECPPPPALGDLQCQPADPGMDSFETFVERLGCPNVHDIHLVIKGFPEAWQRAPLYGFREQGLGGLARFAKKCNVATEGCGCEVWVYRNGTIRLMIDASSRGGLDAIEFNNVVFTLAQSEVYPLIMKAVTMDDFEVVGEPHLNADGTISGYQLPFKTLTLRTLTGVLIRAYEKKLASGKKVLRVEVAGKPDTAANLMALMNGTVSAENRERQFRELIFMVLEELKDYRKFKTEFLSRQDLSSMPQAPQSRLSPTNNPQVVECATRKQDVPIQISQQEHPLNVDPPRSDKCPRMKGGAYPHHAWCGPDFMVWNNGPLIDPFPCCSGFEACIHYQKLKKDGFL